MKCIIDEKWNGKILKDYLTKELSLSSRMIKSLKKLDTGILVNGRRVFVNICLKKGDILELDYTDHDDDVNEYLIKTRFNIKIDFRNLLTKF